MFKRRVSLSVRWHREMRLTLRTSQDEHTLSLGTALFTDGIEQRLGALLRGWGELAVVPLR